MSRLRVRKIAKAEIVSAYDWYRAHSSESAERFLEAIEEGLIGVEEGPERYPVIQGQLRRVLLRRFPYAIYYKIYPATISVVGVIHGHRHPESWLRRADS